MGAGDGTAGCFLPTTRFSWLFFGQVQLHICHQLVPVVEPVRYPSRQAHVVELVIQAISELVGQELLWPVPQSSHESPEFSDVLLHGPAPLPYVAILSLHTLGLYGSPKKVSGYPSLGTPLS